MIGYLLQQTIITTGFPEKRGQCSEMIREASGRGSTELDPEE